MHFIHQIMYFDDHALPYFCLKGCSPNLGVEKECEGESLSFEIAIIFISALFSTPALSLL